MPGRVAPVSLDLTAMVAPQSLDGAGTCYEFDVALETGNVYGVRLGHHREEPRTQE